MSDYPVKLIQPSKTATLAGHLVRQALSTQNALYENICRENFHLKKISLRKNESHALSSIYL